MKGSQEQPQQSKPWTLREYAGKTVWDWLQLLIVPLALVLIGLAFSMQQDARQQQIENQRAARERELEEQRAQDVALQGYLDQMSTLLLGQDLSDDKVQTLLRARTVTVLQRLDSSRQKEVMNFLVEAELLQSVGERDPPIELSGVDLQGINLSGADLRDANLSSANLTGADLTGANLSGANLTDAQVTNEQLEQAWFLDRATMPNGQKYEDWLQDN